MKDQLFEISGKFLGGKKEIRPLSEEGDKSSRLMKYRQQMEQGNTGRFLLRRSMQTARSPR